MTAIEQRPRIKEGSIHCPVQWMRYLIKSRDAGSIARMIRQLRAAWVDPDYADERPELLWLGKRYAAAYVEITGVPCPD